MPCLVHAVPVSSRVISVASIKAAIACSVTRQQRPRSPPSTGRPVPSRLRPKHSRMQLLYVQSVVFVLEWREIHNTTTINILYGTAFVLRTVRVTKCAVRRLRVGTRRGTCVDEPFLKKSGQLFILLILYAFLYVVQLILILL